MQYDPKWLVHIFGMAVVSAGQTGKPTAVHHREPAAACGFSGSIRTSTDSVDLVVRVGQNRVELMTFVTSFFTWCLALSAVSAEDGVGMGLPRVHLGKVTLDLT